MKSYYFFCVFCFILSLKTFCQDDPNRVGFKMVSKGRVIKVYQNQNDSPDVASRFNIWNSQYWFLTDITKKIGDSIYLRITIPNCTVWDTIVHKYLPDTKYEYPIQWNQSGVFIDSDDFNSWLWISKTDFDAFKENYYGRPKFQVTFSGIAVPFKYRPSIGNHATSILNGDINLGTFLGFRRPLFNNTGGVSVGIITGVSSLPMSSSNNDGITDKSSQSISGFNYGGGVVFDWQKKFQIGLVLGFDHAVGDLSKTYIYQDKPWIGFSLNYKFLDFGSKDSSTQSASDTKNKKAN